MVNIASLVGLNYFLPKSILIKWEISDTEDTVENYKFELFRGAFDSENLFQNSPNIANTQPNQSTNFFEDRLDNLELIAVIDGSSNLEHLDSDINTLKVDIAYYYKIRAVSKVDNSASEFFPMVYKFNKEMVQDSLGGSSITSYIRTIQNIYLGVVNNSEGYILKRIRTGERCHSCYDDIRGQISDSDCQECFGTGYTRGYYRPYAIKFAYSSPVINIAEGQSIEGVNPSSQDITIWTNHYPFVSVGDIFINEKNDRYVVKNVQRTTKNNDYVLRQDLVLTKIPYSDIVYKFVFVPSEAVRYYE